MKLHRILFYIYLFLIPIQTRILYSPEKAYISWYFDYHLSIFVYLSDLLLITCFIAWLVFDPPTYRGNPKNRLLTLICGFIAVCLITLFHVKRIDLGVYQTLKWIEFFLILLYIKATYRKKGDFDLSFIVLFVSGVLQGLIGWLQFHVQHGIGLGLLGEYISPLGTPGLANIQTSTGKIIRAYGTMPHPNVLGAFLVLGLILGLYLVSRETGRGYRGERMGYSVGIVIILVGIFATFSRVAWLASALAIICYVGYYLWEKKKNLVFTIILLVAVSSGIIFSFYRHDLQARVTDSNSVSITDRNFFNQVGWEMTKKFPRGVGVGNYIVAMQDLYQLEPWQYQPAHNIFIFISAELGLLGLALFLMIIYEIFSKLKNVSWDPLTTSLVLVGALFVLMSLFDHYFVTIQQGRLMFATVLGLIAAIPNLYDYKKSN